MGVLFCGKKIRVFWWNERIRRDYSSNNYIWIQAIIISEEEVSAIEKRPSKENKQAESEFQSKGAMQGQLETYLGQ